MSSSTSTSRRSPAIIVAVLALVAAVAGTALADPDATTSALTKSKVKKIATKQINKLAPGLSVASANSAQTAQSATTAQTAQSAANADQLDGFHANELARATTQATEDLIFPFDAAQFTGLVSIEVTAPRDGILLVFGQVNVNRDVNSTNPTEVIARGAVDGQPATSEAHARSTQDGSVDQSISLGGAIAVTAGPHTASLQAKEVSSGFAFLTDPSVTTLFVPFGNAG
jgi:hypothetical protein